MTDAPREHRRFGPGNMGQGSHAFKETLIDGAVGDVAAVYQKVIDATEGLPQIPWHRFVRVLPIAFEPHRIYVSKKNTAICRVGEIWPRFIGSGIRFQNGVWLNKATGRVWVTEPRTKDEFSCIHFDSMHDRMSFNDWLAAVWQIAFVDSQGSLPYKRGHASSSDQYFAVDDGGKILPSEDGRYPWSEWENRYLADRRRAVSAVPKADHRQAAGGTGGEGGDGQDGAGRGGNGSPDEDHDGGRDRAGVREQPRQPEHGPHHGNDQGDGELHDQHEGRPGGEDAGERRGGEDGDGDREAT